MSREYVMNGGQMETDAGSVFIIIDYNRQVSRAKSKELKELGNSQNYTQAKV